MADEGGQHEGTEFEGADLAGSPTAGLYNDYSSTASCTLYGVSSCLSIDPTEADAMVAVCIQRSIAAYLRGGLLGCKLGNCVWVVLIAIHF